METLRNGLHAITLLFALLMPFAHGPDYSNDWNLFSRGTRPALSPLITIVIDLDIVMSSIWKSEAEVGRVVTSIGSFEPIGL